MYDPSEQEKLEAKYHWEVFRMAMLSKGEAVLDWANYNFSFYNTKPISDALWADAVTHCVSLGIDENVARTAGYWVYLHLPRQNVVKMKRIDLVANTMEYEVKPVPGSAFVTLNGNAILES